MTIPRLLVALVLLVLALVLAALSYLHFADMDQHAERLEAMVYEATGRQLSIGDGLDLDLWPNIRVAAKEVSLANAEWGSEPQMLTLGSVNAAVTPMSLFSGPIRIMNLQVDNLKLLLESDDNGESNWALGDSEDEADDPDDDNDEGDDNLPVVIDIAELKNITLALRQPGSNQRTLRLEELQIDSRDSEQFTLSGSGESLKLPLKLDGKLGPIARLTDTGSGDFVLDASLGDLKLDASGHVESLDSLAGSKARIAVASPAIETLAAALGLSLPLSGALKIDARLSTAGDDLETALEATLGQVEAKAQLGLQGDELAVEATLSPLDRLGAQLDIRGLPAQPLKLKGKLVFDEGQTSIEKMLATLGSARLTASGTLAGDGGKSTIKLAASGDSLAELMNSLPPLPFKVSSTVARDAKVLELGALRAQVGNTDVEGHARLHTGQDNKLVAALKSSKVDLDELVREPENEAAAPAQLQVPRTAQDDNDSTYVFNTEPLPWDALQNNNIEVEWQIQELLSNTIELNTLVLDTTLKGGNLELDLEFDTATGGHAVNRISLATKGENAKLKVAVSASDLRFSALAGTDQNHDDIPPSSLSFTLDSAGGSQRELAANSDGEILMTQGKGRLDNTLMDTVTTDVLAQLFSSLNPFAKKDPYTKFECGIIAVNIRDGMATIDPAILQQKKVLIVAGGTVDLKTEELNIEFNTRPRSGIGVSADMFVTPFVSLKGTLAAPTMGVNEKGSLLAGASAGAAVATGGLSLLVQGVLNRAKGEIDHCKKTLPKFQHPPMASSGAEHKGSTGTDHGDN